MRDRYRGALAATWLFILIARPALAQQQNPHRPHPRSTARPADPQRQLTLYSSRALRRTRTILQLEMLEIREERLACVREVLERQLPADLLWNREAREQFNGPKPGCLDGL